MSDRWPGGIISGTPPVPTGDGPGDSAPGIWTIEQASSYIATGNWPGMGTPDPQFQYVTALLHGDGTNGGQNNTFIDSSPNIFTITRNGNTTQGSFSPYGDLWSNFFDGTDDYLQTSSSSALAFGSGDFAIEFWINPSSKVRQIPTIYSNNVTFGSNFFAIQFDIDGQVRKVRVFSFNVSSTTPILLSNSQLDYGVWSHIAVTRSGNTFRLFINGILDVSGTSSASVDGGSSHVARIGCGPVNNTDNYAGFVSSLRVVKGSAVYTSDFTPSTTPLTAISGTSLLTCQSNRFLDNSSNNFTFTTNGTPSVQRFSPFQNLATYTTSRVGGSGFFDGTGDYIYPPSSTAFAFGTGDYTMEMWVYAPSAGDDRIIEFSNNQDNIDIGSTGTLNYFNGSGVVSSAAGTFIFGQWNHIAIVRSSGTVTGYINGVSRLTQATTPNTTVARIPYIGGITNVLMNGYISDVRIVKGTAVYSGSSFAVPTAPLTAIPNTQLLCNFTNAAIFDSDASNDFETVGNAQISTSVVKYGTGSIAFDGTGDWLQAPNTPNLALGSGNFTIECWINFNSLATNRGILYFGTNPNSNFSYGLQWASNVLYFWYTTNGSNLASVSAAWTPSTGIWYHLAVSRAGNSLFFFINGSQIGTTQSMSGVTIFNSTDVIRVGGEATGSPTSLPGVMNGYIDELRITKGYARYWYNFQPPTRAFPNYGGTVIEMEDPLFEYNTLLLNGDGANGGQNNTFLDSSTNNFTITRNGNTTQGSFSPYGTLWSNYLATTSERLTTATSSNAFSFGTGDFTVEGWVNLNSVGDNMVFQMSTASTGYNSSTSNTVAMYVGGGVNTGKIEIYANNTQYLSTNVIVTSSDIGQWRHFAIVRASGITKFYWNGNEVAGLNNISDSANYSMTYCVIGTVYVNTYALKGYISNFRAVKGTAVYSGSTYTVPTASLTAITNTSFLTCQSNRFVDNSSNAIGINTSGSPSVQRFSPFEPSDPYSTSVIGGSCVVDGTGDYLQFTNTLNVSGTFTIEGWFYPTTLSFPAFDSGVIIASNKNSGSGVNGIGLALYNTGQLYFFLGNGARIIASPTIAINQWHHFAYVYDGTTVSAYLNGTRVGTSVETIVNNSQITTIGQSVGGVNWDASVRYIGIIGQIRATNTQVYTGATYTVPTTPLTAIAGTNYLVNMSNAAIPDRAMQNNLETVGNAQISTSVVKYGTGSIAFDGNGDYLTSPANSGVANFGTGDFTIETWFYPLANSNYYYLIVDTVGSGVYFGYDNVGTLVLGRRATAADNSASYTPTLNQWTHLAVTRQGGTVRFFVNGNIIFTGSNSINYSGTGITYYYGGIGAAYNGYVDDMRVTKGIARYVQPFTPPTAALPTY